MSGAWLVAARLLSASAGYRLVLKIWLVLVGWNGWFWLKAGFGRLVKKKILGGWFWLVGWFVGWGPVGWLVGRLGAVRGWEPVEPVQAGSGGWAGWAGSGRLSRLGAG